MTIINPVPMANGIQPPSTIFNKFAMRKTVSTAINGAITMAAVTGDQFQHFHITKNAMMLVITIVPVTAMP